MFQPLCLPFTLVTFPKSLILLNLFEKMLSLVKAGWRDS